MHWYATLALRRQVEPAAEKQGFVGIGWCRQNALSGHVQRLPAGQEERSEAAPEGREPEQARAPIWDKAVVENHQMIAIEDFTTLFLARSTMTGKCADGAIGAAKAR